eukprot:355594-Chlamydomonas_euryale.AAC.1
MVQTWLEKWRQTLRQVWRGHGIKHAAEHDIKHAFDHTVCMVAGHRVCMAAGHSVCMVAWVGGPGHCVDALKFRGCLDIRRRACALQIMIERKGRDGKGDQSSPEESRRNSGLAPRRHARIHVACPIGATHACMPPALKIPTTHPCCLPRRSHSRIHAACLLQAALRLPAQIGRVCFERLIRVRVCHICAVHAKQPDVLAG